MVEPGLRAQIYSRFMGIRVTRHSSLKGWLESQDYSCNDVKTITLTHLHPDHTAGLHDFPDAEVYISKSEFDYVNKLESKNYYQRHFDVRHWQHVKTLSQIDNFTENWFGFCAASLPYLENKAKLISLPGHTGGGHSGVAIQLGKRWVFHVGDAYFLQEDLNDELGERHLLSEIIQAAISPNTPLRHKTSRQLADLKKNHSDQIIMISTHEEKDSNQIFNE